jgi:hypothetical protein
VSCRSAWHLPGYDVNEAGQIHAYICDLRQLPYSEQLYWQSFNVEPKTFQPSPRADHEHCAELGRTER